VGKHSRNHRLRSHRKPSVIKAGATTATAAMGTVAVGAVIASSGRPARSRPRCEHQRGGAEAAVYSASPDRRPLDGGTQRSNPVRDQPGPLRDRS